MSADASPDSSPLSPSLAIDRTITLVGLMGVGKSTVGRRLAQRLGLPFHDGDHEIESAAGMTVSEIFASRGEAAEKGELILLQPGEGRTYVTELVAERI